MSSGDTSNSSPHPPHPPPPPGSSSSLEAELAALGVDPLRLQSREISQKMNTDFFSLPGGLDAAAKTVASEVASSASSASRYVNCSG